MKSIISRYGEMKSDPSKLVDSEGEELDFNKVDAALKSVGISMHTVAGEFKNFDDVILELSKKWNTLDKNSQRYIATVMAGNRQQSRFLALVSDYDRLSELTEEAANAEDAALVQTLKTMDSLETKIQNVKNAFQGFYANLGLEELFKWVLDAVTNILNRLNRIPKLFNKIPIFAISIIARIITMIKSAANSFLQVWDNVGQRIAAIIEKYMKQGAENGAKQMANTANTIPGRINQSLENNSIKDKAKAWYNKKGGSLGVTGTAMQTTGGVMSAASLAIDDNNAVGRGLLLHQLFA